MFKFFKWLVSAVIFLLLFATAGVYGFLSLSLPSLNGTQKSDAVLDDVHLFRDQLGHAVIEANSQRDAAYGIGFAHGQDRFFQMDLLRRNAAGELSALFGEAAVNLDKEMRFHQFRKRSEQIVASLDTEHRSLLEAYAKGVNEGRAQSGVNSFEYVLTGAEVKPWQPTDSMLVIFSMYLDLQSLTYERDQAALQIENLFGQQMRAFLMQPSKYQAALDGSRLERYSGPVPELIGATRHARVSHIASKVHFGSNNWAVTGSHTKTGHAMLSDDMHLSLNVPAIWYRAQLNYKHQDDTVQITGVSLPGVPAIVVGTNNKVAWGFTNGYLDVADWVALTSQSKTWQETEQIELPKGQSRAYQLTMSDYGPVKTIQDKQYALSWVAHQPYAVNMRLLDLAHTSSVDEAMAIAPSVGIPVQNMMIVDAQGNAGWQPTGAIPARTMPSDVAVLEADYSAAWQQNEHHRPTVVNPSAGKLWTANARVVSAQQHQRFGDGGYAMGARAQQIRDRLFEKDQFVEQDFNHLQLDNEARFLQPWHAQLSALLSSSNDNEQTYAHDLNYLANWAKCACADSVGYTLVRYYRDALIDLVFSPIEEKMGEVSGTLSPIKRYLETALWQLLEQQPTSWLAEYTSWSELQLAAYQKAKENLTQEYGPQMAAWSWGEVNALKVRHPFSRQMPILSGILDMPSVSAFGDNFMPAIQRSNFGASQRFIAQPGALDNAILTVAGGQSGHPLSPFYRAGFEAYANGDQTPLLPGQVVHHLTIKASSVQ